MASRIAHSFIYAAKGVAATWKSGINFKIQCALGVLACILGFVFAIEPGEWLAIIVCCGAVLGAECANTALESAVDLISPEFNPLAGRAKDCAAGAVLLLSIAALVVAAVIFFPRFLSLFFA